MRKTNRLCTVAAVVLIMALLAALFGDFVKAEIMTFYTPEGTIHTFTSGVYPYAWGSTAAATGINAPQHVGVSLVLSKTGYKPVVSNAYEEDDGYVYSPTYPGPAPVISGTKATTNHWGYRLDGTNWSDTKTYTFP